MAETVQFVVQFVVALIYGRGDKPRHAIQRSAFRGAVFALTGAVTGLAIVAEGPARGREVALFAIWLVATIMLSWAEYEVGNRRLSASALVVAVTLISALILRGVLA